MIITGIVTVPEVGAHGRLVVAVAVAAVDVVVAPVGELARERDERERGVELLPDAAHGLRVEPFDHVLSAFVHLFEVAEKIPIKPLQATSDPLH